MAKKNAFSNHISSFKAVIILKNFLKKGFDLSKNSPIIELLGVV